MGKKQKVFIVIFSLFFVLLISGCGIYFLFFRSKGNIIQQDKRISEIQKPQERPACLDENKEVSYKSANKEDILADLIIFVNNKLIDEEVFSFKIGNVYRTSPRAELHKCGVYTIRVFNYDRKKSKQEPGFKVEIWKYQYDGKGYPFFLLSEKKETGLTVGDYSYAFRVSPNEKYLILEKSYLGKDDYSLVIKDLNTKQDIFVLPAKEIVKQYPNLTGGFDMRDWTKDSRYFWGDIFDGADVLAIFRIDSTAWKREIFEVSPYTMGGTALNPEYGYITYDDGPPWTGDMDFDEINKEKWLKEGKKLNFYLYNLFTKENILLITVDDPLWNFKPQWLSDTEIEYELPTGEKKIYEINGN